MWFYVVDGAQKGPVDAEELQRLARDGKLHARTKVWKNGMQDWEDAAHALPEISWFPGPPPSPAQAYPAPPVTTGMATGATENVPNFLVASILVTLFCCAPTGIPAIVYSTQANSARSRGDWAAAREAADKAKLWLWISLGVAVVAVLFYAFAILIAEM